jgi:hypothetical protein
MWQVRPGETAHAQAVAEWEHDDAHGLLGGTPLIDPVIGLAFAGSDPSSAIPRVPSSAAPPRSPGLSA